MIDDPIPPRQTVLAPEAHRRGSDARFTGDGRMLMIGVLIVLTVVLLASVVTIVLLVNAGIDAARRATAMHHVKDEVSRRRQNAGMAPTDVEQTPPQSASTDAANWVTADDYPATALRDNEQGTVTIRWVVDANGRVGDCTTAISSGHVSLDRAACDAIRRRGRFSVVPPASAPRIFTRRVVWRIPL